MQDFINKAVAAFDKAGLWVMANPKTSLGLFIAVVVVAVLVF